MKKSFLILAVVFLLIDMAYSQCEPISTFPWTEGFEGDDTNFPPCWGHGFSETGWNWAIVPATTGSPATAHGGNNKAQIFLNFCGLPIYSNSLTTPVFDLSVIDDAVLIFHHTQTGPGYLKVYYKNSPSGGWISLMDFTAWEDTDITNWRKETISLPEKSNHYQIIFEGVFLGGGIADVQLDDISISESGHVGINTTDTPKLKIYPNPIRDKFLIEYNEDVQIRLYDMIGNEILDKIICNKIEIDISHLSQGVYILSIISDNIVIGQSKIVKR